MNNYKICPECGLSFKSSSYKQIFCSERCRKQAEHKKYKKTCIICGKKFETIYSYKLTCSPKCYQANNRQKAKERALKKHEPPEIKTCPHCGKQFEVHYGRKYCSDECRIAAAREYRLTRPKPVKICPICGKEFSYPKYKYCSPECSLEALRRCKEASLKKTKKIKNTKERPMTPDTEYYICNWFNQGDSPKKIADILNRSIKSIKDVLRRNGYEVKD